MNIVVFLTQFTVGLFAVLIAIFNINNSDVSQKDVGNLARNILVIGIIVIITSPISGKFTKRKKSRYIQSTSEMSVLNEETIAAPKVESSEVINLNPNNAEVMAHEKHLESNIDVEMEVSGAIKSPWGWGTLLIVSLLGGWGAAGFIAFGSWRRMGLDKLALPTLIVAIVGYIMIGVMIISPNGFLPTYPIGILFIWGLGMWQRPYRLIWKEIHPDARRAGWQIPAVTVIITILTYIVWIFIRWSS